MSAVRTSACEGSRGPETFVGTVGVIINVVPMQLCYKSNTADRHTASHAHSMSH